MPAFGTPFVAEAMDPIKKSGKWIHYIMPFLEKKTTTMERKGITK